MHSPNSNKSFDIQIANWRMESIVRESESGSDDEFFDCQGKVVMSRAHVQHGREHLKDLEEMLTLTRFAISE